MKQGRASHSGSGATKVEPRPQAMNPAGVAQIGIMLGNHVTDGGPASNPAVSIHAGRGLKAPMVGSTSHHCGSQGKHK